MDALCFRFITHYYWFFVSAAWHIKAIWHAGILELVGGTLILIGLFTRPVAFILSGQMAVAYFMMHAPKDFLPINNNGELAVMFSFVFLYFSVAGAGKLSIDAVRSK